MKWLNFLHFYQPASAPAHVICEAADQSYVRIIKALEKAPEAKLTANIAGCLLLRLDELGYSELINRLKNLLDRGQLELVGSAAYHPILPLVGREEAFTQIKENEEILKKFFGGSLALKGFYFPECAVSPDALLWIKKLGYEWTILDSASVSGMSATESGNRLFADAASGLAVVIRSRSLSNSYIPNTIKDMLAAGADGQNVITVSDAELIGLRYGDWSGNFEEVIRSPKLKTLAVSEFISLEPAKEICSIRSSNWESTEEELSKGLPFAIWNDPENDIHKKLWELAAFAGRTLKKYQADENCAWARWHYVRGIASCVFWWASGKEFSHVFGPVAWNPDEVERGLGDLIRAVRSINNPAAKPEKIKAEELFAHAKKILWQTHWEKYA